MTECTCAKKGLLFFSFFLTIMLSKVGPTVTRATPDPSASTGPSAAKSSPYRKQLKDYPPTRVSVINALDTFDTVSAPCHRCSFAISALSLSASNTFDTFSAPCHRCSCVFSEI